jgi:hypothetical protein
LLSSAAITMPAITAAAARIAMMMLLPPPFEGPAFDAARTGFDATDRLAAGFAEAASAGAAAIEIADMATKNFENRINNSLFFRLHSHPSAVMALIDYSRKA